MKIVLQKKIVRAERVEAFAVAKAKQMKIKREVAAPERRSLRLVSAASY